jgi:dipeptidyl aminopeptidase/acylaminoacyl peptidase
MKRAPSINGLALLLPLGAVAADVAPQAAPVPTSVYARAEALLGPNLEPKVLNVFVTPHWLGGRDEFWYRRELVDGAEFVRVDAASGAKRAAFDHAAVARSLGTALGKTLDAKHLPIEELDFSGDGKHLTITAASRVFDCGLNGDHCVEAVQPAAHGQWLMSPDGHSGVSTRAGNLWLGNAASGEAKALTTDGLPDAGFGIYPDGWSANLVSRYPTPAEAPPLEARWAPDSRTLLVPFVDQRKVAAYPYIESAPADSLRPRVYPIRIPLVGEHTAVWEWWLFDAGSGQRRHVELPYEKLLTLQQDMTAFREISWSSDSKHLYLVAHGDNMESAFVFDVDVATGKSRIVLEEHLAPRTDLNSTSYDPVNVQVVKDGRELIWFSQRDGWGHLYRYDMRSGKLLNRITGGNWLVRDIIDIDEARGIIYFTGGGREPGDPYLRYLYRVNFDGSGLKLLSPEPADHLLLPHKRFVLTLDGITAYAPTSPSGRYVLYNYSTIDKPTKFVIRRTADASLVAEVETADAAQLYAAGWRAPTGFSVKLNDGTDLWGVMYKPSDFDATRRYPIIDAQYASPLTAVVPHNFYQAYRGKQPLAPSSYAELGFVVVSVDARGTTYRSEKFLHAGYGALNRVGLDDHIAAIRELAATRNYMDVDRVGIVGHSYGGFVALRALLEFPDFFKVGISSAAMIDTEGMYADYHWSAFHGKPRYSDGSEWRPSPNEVASNWKNLSAAAQVHQLKGKLLLQMGELDENVPPGQILQFVNALIKDNRDFELIYMPSRDHQFIGDGYVMRRDWDFMVRNLQGREPPPDYRIGVNRR